MGVPAVSFAFQQFPATKKETVQDQLSCYSARFSAAFSETKIQQRDKSDCAWTLAAGLHACCRFQVLSQRREGQQATTSKDIHGLA